MPRARRSMKKSRSNRRRSARSNLSGTRVSSHLVWFCQDLDVQPGLLVQTFSMSKLCGQFSKAFAEMRVDSAVITYRSRLPTSNTGSYVMMVCDNESDITSFAWSEGWFKTIACYPGAKIRKQYQNCTSRWWPSEAGDKNYFRIDESHQIFTLIICFDWADTSTKVLGEIDIRVRLRGRGLNKRNITMARVIADVKRRDSDDQNKMREVEESFEEIGLRQMADE